ncbi:MAG: hypothetical protein ABJN26_06970 [Stappiaceae bacterium]
METAETLILLTQIYAVIGMIIAIPFLLFGIDRVEPSARGTYAFRPLLIPGVILIWPLVIHRWIMLERAGVE